MKKQLLLVTLFSLVSTMFCSAQYYAGQHLLTPVSTQIDEERSLFEGIYYELVKKEHFPSSYNNNLIIDSSLGSDFEKEGSILLSLIDWLEQQDDRDSCFLLKKLNKLFFLEFHRFIVTMDLKQEWGKAILAYAHDLYNYEIKHEDNDLEAPFMTSLTKAFLVIRIINKIEHNYERRKETLAFALDKIKREMLKINDQAGAQKIDQETIKSFVTLLEIYSVHEPLVETQYLKKMILLSLIGILIGALVYKYGIPSWTDVTDWAEKASNAILRPIGKGLTKGVLDEAEPKIKDLKKEVFTKIDELKDGLKNDDQLKDILKKVDEKTDPFSKITDKIQSWIWRNPLAEKKSKDEPRQQNENNE